MHTKHRLLSFALTNELLGLQVLEYVDLHVMPSPFSQYLLHSSQRLNMHIVGLQKMTLLDYPGKVACTVFLGGCNFRCPFCHNPDLVFASATKACISEQEFFEFLSQRKGFLEGVCITGGEPLLEKGLDEFIRKIGSLGFLVKLDTNGSFPDRLNALVNNHLVDYVAMDIKNSREHYGTTIGIPAYDTTNVEQSVAILMEGTFPYEFRTTLVREYHTQSDILAIGAWLQGCQAYFLQTFVDSGNLLGKESLTAFSHEEMQGFKNLLKSHIGTISIRG